MISTAEDFEYKIRTIYRPYNYYLFITVHVLYPVLFKN